MKFKNPITSIALTLLALSIISVLAVQQNAYAEIMGMSLTAQAEEGSDTIRVYGQTASKVTDITFTVTSPDGFNKMAVAQTTPDSEGKYSTQFKISPLWKQNGFYTITAMQGVRTNSLYTMAVEVEVINGIAMETIATESNLETGLFMPKESSIFKGFNMKANALEGSDTIAITGKTDRTNVDITVKVKAPNGNVVTVKQITPKLDGTFSANIMTGGPLWIQDGDYTIIAQQGDLSDHMTSAKVGIVEGRVIPEFGAIAALILAVAIISIIAISAKSKLSIMPRY
jgi:predicted secreted protein with PEFG-CTERM motif